VPLLCSNTQLDRAIERLDPVIGRFPALVSARHARGTAHFRKWLNSASIQAQQLRSGPLTYSSRSGGDPLPAADVLSLYRARRDFAAILEREPLPYTLASLAVLEAYAGGVPGALRRAERALAALPGDPVIQNQLGLIRFLAGDVPAAAEEFRRAAGAMPAPWVVFNRAKCAALMEDPAAEAMLLEYLQLDPATQWRCEAARLLGRRDEVVGRIARNPPEVLPGLTLYVPGDRVVDCCGRPSRQQHWRGLLLWNYDRLDLEIMLCPVRGTLHVELGRASPGAVEGVRAGDPLPAALARWGDPVESGEGQLVFWAGEWGIGLEHDDRSTIVTLSLGTQR
jgi:hypothetical protein